MTVCRRRGSRKHGSNLASSGLVAGILQAVVSMAIKRRLLLPFPHTIIFCSLATFLVDLPALSQFEVLGQRFSDKTFVLLAAAELLYLARPGATLSATCCVIAGVLVRVNALGLGSFRIPAPIADLFSLSLGRLLYSQPPNDRPARRPAGSQERDGPSARQGAAPLMAEPSPEAVQQLQAMGFPVQQVKVALQQSGNDVQMALALLLSSDHQ